ncbi:MAG: thioredoxin family protein [Mycoplasma sp.]|nr:thioredoxin family protein [Mycoplasma sp.]
MKKQIFEINSKEELESIFAKNQGILILDFTSPTCGPCLMLEPVLEELVEKNICSVAKINILDNQDLAREYEIRVTPTVLIAKDQEIKEVILGYQPLEAWEELIKKI